MNTTEIKSSQIEQLLDAAFAQLQHDTGPQDPEYVFQRQYLHKEFLRILRFEPESPACPFDGIVAAYQLALPMLAKVSKLTPTRRAQLLRRWDEDPERQNLAWWRAYFKRAATSDFLTGRTSNDRNWRPTIDFFLQPKSMTNIIEGAYGIGSGRNAREELMDDVQREQDRLLASARGIE